MTGLYIHIPFCGQACTYCDFHFSTSLKNESLVIGAIKRELAERKSESQGEIRTIYFGGGTPSVLSERTIASMMEVIHAEYNVNPDAEVTLEANPDDITDAKLNEWQMAGINRLSIGIQTFDDEILSWMKRTHTGNDAVKAVFDAQDKGFENITIDLIYGLPGYTIERWVEYVRKAEALGISHLSAYCLTVEPRTHLAKMVEKGEIVMPSDEEAGEQFMTLITELDSLGMKQYEVSNFARKGFESKHNTSYWQQYPYIGIGPSAHSFDGKSRRWNIANNAVYSKNLEAGESYYESEELSINDRYNEAIMTGLRTVQGVNIDRLDEIQPGLGAKFTNDIQALGFMVNDHPYFRLTTEGLLLADRIASDLFMVD